MLVINNAQFISSSSTSPSSAGNGASTKAADTKTKLEFAIDLICAGDDGENDSECTMFGLERRRLKQQHQQHMRQDSVLRKPNARSLDEDVDGEAIHNAYRVLERQDERCFCPKDGKEDPPEKAPFIRSYTRTVASVLENNKLGKCESCGFNQDCESDNCVNGRCVGKGDKSASSCGVQPVCGNGVQEANEECDDGNTDNEDDCTNACTVAFCGDGIVGPYEQCDDGNDVDKDECTNTCTLAVCGDGIVGPNEECDDGNTIDEDSCTNSCMEAICGDGLVGPNEECDDGNSVGGDGCNSDCKVEQLITAQHDDDPDELEALAIDAFDDETELDLLANDCCGDSLMIVDVADPEYGVASISSDGKHILYDPSENSDPPYNLPVGETPVSFEYTISNGSEESTPDVTVFVTRSPICGDRLREGNEVCDDVNCRNFCQGCFDGYYRPENYPACIMITANPTSRTTSSPTPDPTSTPTSSPSNFPSSRPTKSPSLRPTMTPSIAPTLLPSEAPTFTPSEGPTSLPSETPTYMPSEGPSPGPTDGLCAEPCSVTNLFNTGQTRSSGDDPNYYIEGFGQAIVKTQGTHYGVRNTNDSRWIWRHNFSDNDTLFLVTTFEISCGCDLSAISITGIWNVDNVGQEMWINGDTDPILHSSPSHSSTSGSAFTITPGAFVVGRNEIRFQCWNRGRIGGLRVDNLMAMF